MTAPNQAKRLHDYLIHRQTDMVELLSAMVTAESPSHVPEAQRPVQDILTGALRDCGFRVRHVPGDRTGGQLFAVPDWRMRGRPIQLMLGHCDTVWPLGTLEKMPVDLREGRLHGPGVYDMKAGLVQAIFAVRAVRELALKSEVAPVFFINSDEEIGSPESSTHIRRLARSADRVFVMEPSLGPAGKLKTRRKGVGRFVIRVIGRAAHAGLSPEKGVSAILELSHVVQTLFALNDPERGITVNVGTIDGGLRPNVIAPESTAQVDVRVATNADAEFIERKIHAIEPTTPGTSLEITGRIGRPPMEKTPGNQRLWEYAQEAADELGLDIDEGMAGGGSDGNSTSQLTPTLDGMGAVGDGAHAVTEFVSVEQMPKRAALLARMLLFPRMTEPTDAGDSLMSEA
jgi:glutamate carboxypeptidase